MYKLRFHQRQHRFCREKKHYTAITYTHILVAHFQKEMLHSSTHTLHSLKIELFEINSECATFGARKRIPRLLAHFQKK